MMRQTLDPNRWNLKRNSSSIMLRVSSGACVILLHETYSGRCLGVQGFPSEPTDQILRQNQAAHPDHGMRSHLDQESALDKCLIE